MRDIDATVFIETIKAGFPKLKVDLEHTGGGCGTLYVRDENDNLVCIGPGQLYPHPVFSFDELFVGPEDEDFEGASIEVVNFGEMLFAIKLWMRIIPIVAEIKNPARFLTYSELSHLRQVKTDKWPRAFLEANGIKV